MTRGQTTAKLGVGWVSAKGGIVYACVSVTGLVTLPEPGHDPGVLLLSQLMEEGGGMKEEVWDVNDQGSQPNKYRWYK